MTDPDEEIVVVDVSTVIRPDIATIDALARLGLAVRRRGGRVELYGASGALRELLDLAGLTGLTAAGRRLPAVDERQAEEREQPGLQEVRDVGNPTA